MVSQLRHAQGQAPLYLWGIAGLAAWGTTRCWEVGQKGDDGACLLAALLALIATRSLWAGLVSHDQRRILKRLRRVSKKKSSVHGSSGWATRKDIRALEKPGGIFLGEFEGRELFYKGENSVTILAPPGAGKTTCFSMQFLLRTNHDLVIVNDPKLELWLCSKNDLEKRGYRVLLISPWYQSFIDQFGGRIQTHDDGFDPCSVLDPNAPCIIDDTRLLATLLIPPASGGKSDATSDFFNDFSRSIITAFCLLSLSEKGSVTLRELRSRIMAPEESVMEDIAAMLASTAFTGVLAEEGSRLYSPKINAPKEWSGGISGAMRALKSFDAHSPLGRSVEKAGVDFRNLHDRKTVVFFAQPPEKIESHEGYASMVLVLAMEMIARDRHKKRCAFLLDELQNTPSALLPVLKGIALYRGSGIQFICLFQFLAALKRHIGDSWREFLSVDVFATFGIPADPETADIISRLAGQSTVRGTSYSSDAEGLADGGLGVGVGSQDVGRALLTADEARTMDRDEALLFMSNLPPMRIKKQSYLKNPKLRKRAERNPYYEE